jgi:isocitrate dehydrogenase (NAD+)
MAHHVTIIPGSSTEDTPLTTAMMRVLAATSVEIEWEHACLNEGQPDHVLVEAIKKTGRALMPYVPVNRARGDLPPIVQLRRALRVFGNVRPVETVPGLRTRHPNVDIIIVRETTEDIYANLEHESIRGVYESFKVTTEAACERIAREAFELAKRRNRKKVTIVHKANIMKKSDGLFLRTGQRVAQDYPDIETEDVIVDALCMKLVLHPERFDVLMCANLFGDIVADLCAGLVGGPPNCPSVNVGEDATIYTVGHGDGARTAATDAANPTNLLFSSVLMLRDLGEDDAADRLMKAISDTLEADVTPIALGGTATTTDFANAIIERLS